MAAGPCLPADTWEAVLLERGRFVAHEAARRFLAEFGYAGVSYPAPGQTPPGPEFRLDPEQLLGET